MEEEVKMCAACNVAMVDGVCPQCGAHAEAEEATTDEAAAE